MLPPSRIVVFALPLITLGAVFLRTAAAPGILGLHHPTVFILPADPSGAAGPVEATARTHWVSDLWRVEFTVNDIISLVAAESARHETRFEGMKYSVGPFPDMFVSPANLAGSFWAKLFDPRGKPVQLWESVGPAKLPPSPDDPTQRALLVGRHAAFRCNDSIRVQTDGSRHHTSAPNTFMISSHLLWPVKWTQGPASMNLGEGTSIYAMPEQEVPYEYQVLVNTGTVDLPAYPPALRMKKITRTITYSITRKRMELELLPQCTGGQSSGCVKDLVGTKWLICSTCTRVTDNYAVDDQYGEHRIHPNVDIRLKIDGEDATHYMMTTTRGDLKYFDIARRRRSWEATLLTDNESVGGYRPSPGRGNIRNGWYDDYTGKVGTGKFTQPNWYDMPSFGVRDPTTWLRLRTLEEFLVGVKRFPEFGFIYFATMVDTRPGGWYRVRQTRARPVTEDEWCSIERTSSGPQVQTAPIRDDSGWCNVNAGTSAPGCMR